MRVKCVFRSRFAAALGVDAITLYPLIFFADDRGTAEAEDVVAHEYVHVLQIRALGWFRFYWTYLVQYFRLRAAGKSAFDAYMGVSYEQQAYAGQGTQEVPPSFDS